MPAVIVHMLPTTRLDYGLSLLDSRGNCGPHGCSSTTIYFASTTIYEN